MATPIFELQEGKSPLIATAVHHGHELREETAALMHLDARQRLHEEDPYTGGWTRIAATRFVVHRSRFEVDVNRPRDRAVYSQPDHAWGLEVWQRPPSGKLLERSLAAYDDFYAELARVLKSAESAFGSFVVYDLHSYNHRRGGSEAPFADPAANPDINVGTGSMDRRRWAQVIDRFLDELRAHRFPGRKLDVRENVRFRGGHLAAWVHETFPRTGCVLAIEVKKFFMDEHTGELYEDLWEAVGDALAATVPAVLEELRQR